MHHEEEEAFEEMEAGAALRYHGVRLYLDTANAAQLEKWLKTGLFYGVTTNPTVLKRDGVKCEKGALIKLAGLVRDSWRMPHITVAPPTALPPTRLTI
jgi:hypothetical protein